MPADPDRPLVVHVDVTDTVATHWRAGIQRVVVQLLTQLDGDPRLRVVPVVWLESVRGFRTLTPPERRRLDPRLEELPSAAPSTTSGGLLARVRPVLGAVRRTVVAALVALGWEPVLRRARRWIARRTRDRSLVPLAVEPAPGSVLLDMDTVWNNTWIDRDDLYRELRRRGVHVAVVVYDLLPQQHPEWFEPSLVEVSNRTLAAQARSAEVVFAISRHTASSFTRWAGEQGLRPVEPVVVTLGADAAPPSDSPAALPPELEGVRYVLAVGTVEPRKNHATLLDAFDRLARSDPDAHLVVVGRPGWHNEQVLARLQHHPEMGRRLHWYRSAGDDLLATLYAHARVVAVASITEGYGLPVIEAMAHGAPVVASDGGALVEAGGELVDHVGALDVEAWVATLGELLANDARVERRRAELASFRLPGWSGTGSQVAEVLLGRFPRGAV